MGRDPLKPLEAKVEAVVREYRRLREAHRELEAKSRERDVSIQEAREERERTMRDLRSVLGSAVRILREE